MEQVKRKVGRPKKTKKGQMIWCPDFCLDSVQAFIETLKQQNQQQAKTS